jgi:hypothetical protein
MKVGNLSPVVGWLIGSAVGLAVFVVGGIPIVFAAAFATGHQPSDDIPSKAFFFAVLLAVIGGCSWIAWRVRRVLSRTQTPGL